MEEEIDINKGLLASSNTDFLKSEQLQETLRNETVSC